MAHSAGSARKESPIGSYCEKRGQHDALRFFCCLFKEFHSTSFLLFGHDRVALARRNAVRHALMAYIPPSSVRIPRHLADI
mmetsp:Transcript_128339/g.233261  ORF Transcript_128339/g.233261 Transcript_128339/m.233261 type:complete len:81 (-) Transcript_128339:122-364(-)